MSARDRSAGVLVEDAQILLMHRWRGEDEYFVVPGGGVEDGETPEQACAREMLEEVNLSVEVGDLIREMPDGDRVQRFYRVTRTGGDMRLGDDPELQAGDPENRYQPEWVPLSTLATMPVRPASILPTLLSLLWSQTDTDPKVLADLANASDEAYQES